MLRLGQAVAGTLNSFPDWANKSASSVSIEALYILLPSTQLKLHIASFHPFMPTFDDNYSLSRSVQNIKVLVDCLAKHGYVESFSLDFLMLARNEASLKIVEVDR